MLTPPDFCNDCTLCVKEDDDEYNSDVWMFCEAQDNKLIAKHHESVRQKAPHWCPLRN